MVRPKNADPEGTMGAITEAATELLREGKSLSLRTVANAAGVSTSTVRYYFPTIQDILETLIAPFVQEGRELVLAYLSESGDSLAGLKRLQRDMAELIARQRFMAHVLHQSTALSGHQPPERRLRQQVGPLLARVASRLSDELGLPEGAVRLALAIGGVMTMRLSLFSDALLCGITGLEASAARARRDAFLDELTDVAFAIDAIEAAASLEGSTNVEEESSIGDAAGEILDAARDLAMSGEELGLRGVARASGRTLGAVRHYFPTRRALVLALIARQDRCFLRISERHMALAQSGPWEPWVARVIDESFRLAVRERSVVKLHHDETYAQEMDYLDSHRATRETRREHFASVASDLGVELGDLALRAHCTGLVVSHLALLSEAPMVPASDITAPYIRGLGVMWIRNTRKRETVGCDSRQR